MYKGWEAEEDIWAPLQPSFPPSHISYSKFYASVFYIIHITTVTVSACVSANQHMIRP